MEEYGSSVKISFNTTKTAYERLNLSYTSLYTVFLAGAGIGSETAQTGQPSLVSGMDGGVSEISYFPTHKQFSSFSSSFQLCAFLFKAVHLPTTQ